MGVWTVWLTAGMCPELCWDGFVRLRLGNLQKWGSHGIPLEKLAARSLEKYILCWVKKLSGGLGPESGGSQESVLGLAVFGAFTNEGIKCT